MTPPERFPDNSSKSLPAGAIHLTLLQYPDRHAIIRHKPSEWHHILVAMTSFMRGVGAGGIMILNLGCGGKTSSACVNIDWNIHLRIARNPLFRWVAMRALSTERVRHLQNLRTNIYLHNLKKGIPFPDNSADAVYHSHVLEHIDRNDRTTSHDAAAKFLQECRRVLKPGGVLRVVVPDFEERCRRYLQRFDQCSAGTATWKEVDDAVYAIIGQAVRKESSGTSGQRPMLRAIENIVLGDARKRGETHQWEYDRRTLSGLLDVVGFTDIQCVDYLTSGIPGWNEIGLDLNDGREYKPGSIYVEAVK